MKSLKTVISAEEATVLIGNNQPLINCHIQGTLDLHKSSHGHANGLVLDNCYVEELVYPCVRFTKSVKLTKTHIRKSTSHGVYFLDGLLMENCICDAYLDFEAGGHNAPGTSFVLNNSTFHGFVSFLDAWFQGDVTVTNNLFKNGTNLLGNRGTPLEAGFDFEPTIKNNSGRIDDNGDGGKPVHYINLL
jgi:hypothetical protein